MAGPFYTLNATPSYTHAYHFTRHACHLLDVVRSARGDVLGVKFFPRCGPAAVMAITSRNLKGSLCANRLAAAGAQSVSVTKTEMSGRQVRSPR